MMHPLSRWPRRCGLLTTLAILTLIAPCVHAQWKQFGGPDQNFSVQAGDLATEWSPAGPHQIWSRGFGDGFSSIVVEGDRVYGMHRDGDKDVVVAMDAATGRTVWEHSYDSPALDNMILDFGPGPIATPLISGDRLFTVSSTVKFHAFDKTSGKVLWSKDLMADMSASHMGRGYGPSPIAYGDWVILHLGVARAGVVVAFRQSDGEEVWKTETSGASYSNPILGTVAGEEQLLIASRNTRLGLNPETGSIRWELDLPSDAGIVMAAQNWSADDQVLVASQAYGDGTRAIKITKESDGSFKGEPQWYSRKLRVMYASWVRIGDYVYGTSGDFGPTFLAALSVKTGDLMWRKRGFARAHFLHAGGDTVLLLDEEGDLALATVTSEGLTVHSRAKILERTCWTPPTMVGTTLYVRNRKEIKAFDLGAASSAGGER